MVATRIRQVQIGRTKVAAVVEAKGEACGTRSAGVYIAVWDRHPTSIAAGTFTGAGTNATTANGAPAAAPTAAAVRLVLGHPVAQLGDWLDYTALEHEFSYYSRNRGAYQQAPSLTVNATGRLHSALFMLADADVIALSERSRAVFGVASMAAVSPRGRKLEEVTYEGPWNSKVYACRQPNETRMYGWDYVTRVAPSVAEAQPYQYQATPKQQSGKDNPRAVPTVKRVDAEDAPFDYKTQAQKVALRKGKKKAEKAAHNRSDRARQAGRSQARSSKFD
jgi:hypothetical protein